jgi:hypothetical protein
VVRYLLLTSQIDSWLRYSHKELPQAKTLEEFTAFVEDLNWYLRLRTFFSGYAISLADVAMWVALSGLCALLRILINSS